MPAYLNTYNAMACKYIYQQYFPVPLGARIHVPSIFPLKKIYWTIDKSDGVIEKLNTELNILKWIRSV